MKKPFSEVFRIYRLKSNISTLHEFGKILANEEGIFLEDSIFSRWQNGNRVPVDRNLLLKIAAIFIRKHGISSLNQINELLESTGQGFLTRTEEESFFDSLKEIQFPFLPREILRENNYSEILESFNVPTDKDNFIESQIHLSHDLLYRGFPLEAFKRLCEIEKYIKNTIFKSEKTRIRLLNRLRWVKLRCLSDICKPGQFKKGIIEAKKNLSFAIENKTEDLGALYWATSAIMRLQVITTKNELSKVCIEDCLRLVELAISNTSNNQGAEMLVEYIEIAKIALLIEDRKLFDEYFSLGYSLLSRLPKESRHLASMLWDVKARASLKFGNDVDGALENIQFARSFLSGKYQAINLYVSVTETQALTASDDKGLLRKAKKLQEETMFIASILGNPHQKERLEEERFFGI